MNVVAGSERRYGMPGIEFLPGDVYRIHDLEFLPGDVNDYHVTPQSGVRAFVEEMNAVSRTAKQLFVADLHTPGMIVDFLPARYPSKHLMDVLIHGRFSLSSIIGDTDVEDFSESFLHKNYGVLIEHINTGYFFAVYKDEDDIFQSMEIFDFEGSPLSPTNIEQAVYTTDFQIFEDTEIDAEGTRAGGIPLNSDGTPYEGPWPSFYGDHRTMYFTAQCQLPDGRYLHVFHNDDMDDPEEGSEGDGISDSYTCALVDGVPVTPFTTLRQDDERPLIMPDGAVKDIRELKGAKRKQPFWVQGDDSEPNDPNYDFIFHFALDSMGSGRSVILENGIFDYYVYWNDREGKALIVSQCF